MCRRETVVSDYTYKLYKNGSKNTKTETLGYLHFAQLSIQWLQIPQPNSVISMHVWQLLQVLFPKYFALKFDDDTHTIAEQWAPAFLLVSYLDKVHVSSCTSA